VARVKLTLEVEPELRRRIKLSATAKDESLREWMHRAILHELEAEGGEARNEEALDEGREDHPSRGGSRGAASTRPDPKAVAPWPKP
jgi:hypothetical protein